MTKKKKISEAQLKSIKKYRAKNPEETRRSRYKTTARTFVRHHAEAEDIAELLKIYYEENPNAEANGDKELNEILLDKITWKD